MNGRTWTTTIMIAVLLLALASGGFWLIAAAVSLASCGTAPTGGGVFSGLAFLISGDQHQLGTLSAVCQIPVTLTRVLDVIAVILVCVAVGVSWALVRSILQTPAALRWQLLFRDGFAMKREVRTSVSAKQALNRAAAVRPTLANPQVRDVAWRIGVSRGVDVYASIEESVSVLGPPRMGKGFRVLISAILDWSGPLVTTSTRNDNLAATLSARAKRGKVVVVDPQRLSGVESRVVVVPSHDCEDPETAVQRARQIIAGTALGKSGSNQEWAGESGTILARLLHAAAVSGRGAQGLFDWGSGPGRARAAVEILRSDGAAGWADSLEATLDGDPELLASKWLGVNAAVQPLAIPSLMASMTPQPGQEVFDPEKFLAGENTLFLIGTGSGAGAAGGFLGAVLDDVVAVARRKALASPGSRLDPPLGLVLDEIANMFAWPELPTILSDGGGVGISTLVVLQGLSQAKSAWSAAEADTIWNSSTIKLMLGGASDTSFLRDVSALLGTRKVSSSSTTTTEESSSTSTHKQDRPVMTEDELRRLPEGMGLMLFRNRRGILLDMPAWTDRSDSGQIKAAKTATEHAQQDVFARQRQERSRNV